MDEAGFLRKMIMKIVVPKHCKYSFLKTIDRNGKLLDVGCGNNSPYYIKTNYPHIHYTGIDVGDYNQTKPNLADSYIVVKPEDFADAIANTNELFDTVISSHNIEHCNDRDGTLKAVIKVLKPGGILFLSFPTERSVDFPSRKGTLNYYDDDSHKDKPPDYDEIIALLKANNIRILFASKSYKPFFLRLRGFFQERKSQRDKEVQSCTWEYYGFESIIWAKKLKDI